MSALTESPSKKQPHLEAVRGLAALLVVLCHFFSAFYPHAVFGGQYAMHESWEPYLRGTPLGIVFAGYFAVCLFFVLSGYVLSLQYFGKDARDNDHLLGAIIKRPFRLGGLVLLSVAVSVLGYALGLYFNREIGALPGHANPWLAGAWSDFPSYPKIMRDMVLAPFSRSEQYNVTMWTIALELYGSILVFLFLLLFRRSRYRALAYLWALFMLRGYLFQGFIIGVALADLSQNFTLPPHVLLRNLISVPLAALGLFFGAYPYYLSKAEQVTTLYGVLPDAGIIGGGYPMLGAILIFLAVQLSSWLQAVLRTRLLGFLGFISYALYAFHFIVLGSLACWIVLVLQGRVEYSVSVLIALAASLALLLPVCYLITVYVDVPVTKFANHIAKLWSASNAPRPPAKAAPAVEIPPVGVARPAD